jgi:hypothetical protein
MACSGLVSSAKETKGCRGCRLDPLRMAELKTSFTKLLTKSLISGPCHTTTELAALSHMCDFTPTHQCSLKLMPVCDVGHDGEGCDLLLTACMSLHLVYEWVKA